jgi:hypothetical protein
MVQKRCHRADTTPGDMLTMGNSVFVTTCHQFVTALFMEKFMGKSRTEKWKAFDVEHAGDFASAR